MVLISYAALEGITGSRPARARGAAREREDVCVECREGGEGEAPRSRWEIAGLGLELGEDGEAEEECERTSDEPASGSTRRSSARGRRLGILGRRREAECKSPVREIGTRAMEQLRVGIMNLSTLRASFHGTCGPRPTRAPSLRRGTGRV